MLSTSLYYLHYFYANYSSRIDLIRMFVFSSTPLKLQERKLSRIILTPSLAKVSPDSNSVLSFFSEYDFFFTCSIPHCCDWGACQLLLGSATSKSCKGQPLRSS
jgi:hypothetical protein